MMKEWQRWVAELTLELRNRDDGKDFDRERVATLLQWIEYEALYKA